MLKAVANKFLMALYLLFGSIILEIICFHSLGLGVFPKYWLYDIAIVLFLAMIIFAIPNYTAQFVISTIILIVHAILVYANYTLYCIYGGELFTFDMFALIREAREASNSTFFNYTLILQLILVVTAIITMGVLLLKQSKKHKINLKNHYSILLVGMFALFELISLGTVFGYRTTINATSATGDYITTDSFLMNTTFFKEASFKKFGTYGFYTNLLLSDYQANENETELAAIKYFNSGESYNNSPVFGVDSGNNVIVIMMESLEWFAFGNGTYDPELKNLSYELTPNIYNLIYGNDNEVGTEDDGLIAKNFFSKAKTNISEGFGVMGNYPIGQNLSSIAGKGYDVNSNTFGYTLPSVLKGLGYNTAYIHSHDITFYSRGDTHKSIGFDTVFGKNDILNEEGSQKYVGDDILFHNWITEESFVKQAIDYIVPQSSVDGEPFYSFYLNVSTHGDYNNNQANADQVKYKNLVIYNKDCCIEDEEGNYILNPEIDVEDLKYTEFYKNLIKNYGDKPEFCQYAINYQASVMGLDAGIGVIVKRLKDYHILDNTTLLLYSDHYAYYNSLTYDIKGMASNNVEDIVELDTIPFIISSPGIKKLNNNVSNEFDYTEYDFFCSAYDIIPTIFDLLGVSFNQNFYAGSSIFKPYETYEVEIEETVCHAPVKVYYSNVGGIYSQYAYTGDLVNYSTVKSAIITEEEIAKIKAEAIRVVTKLYNLSVLNKNALFNKITNNKFMQINANV